MKIRITLCGEKYRLNDFDMYKVEYRPRWWHPFWIYVDYVFAPTFTEAREQAERAVKRYLKTKTRVVWEVEA